MLAEKKFASALYFCLSINIDHFGPYATEVAFSESELVQQG